MGKLVKNINHLEEILRLKIQEARLNKNAWLLKSNCETWKIWENQLQAYEYCLQLINWIKDYPTANHIKVFLDEDHSNYLCFDKDANGVWSESTYEYEV